MSIYATNYTVNELTGETSLIKHLNKKRIDRGGWNILSRAKGWNKSGKKNRIKKGMALGKNYLVKSNIEVREKLNLIYFLNKIKNEN